MTHRIPGLSRTSDPYTSHDAAVSVVGTLTRQHNQILEFLLARPDREGFAPEQISDVIGFSCWRRMSELEKKKYIVETGQLHRNRSNRMARKFRIARPVLVENSPKAKDRGKPMAEEEPQHSPLGPSAAAMWTRCPGSIRATKALPNDSNIYAAEGTAAHKVGDNCLRKGKDAKVYKGQTVEVEGWSFEVDSEMVRGVQMYVDVVRELAEEMGGATIHAEKRVYLTKIHPDVWGTADATLIKGKKLTMIDFKYGRGVVAAKENEQLLCYSIGALLEFDKNKEVQEIEMIIVQPRTSEPVRRWTVTRQYLNTWAKFLRKAALATDDPDAPRIPGDKQCMWCRFRASCPELQALVLERTLGEFEDDDDLELPDVGEMEIYDIAKVLRWTEMIRSYLNSVETRALRMLEQGETVEGRKLVDKLGRRAWTDAEKVRTWLVGWDYQEDDFMTKPELLSPAQIDEILTREQREEIAEFWESKSSGTKMVSENDPAPAVAAGPDSDFADD